MIATASPFAFWLKAITEACGVSDDMVVPAPAKVAPPASKLAISAAPNAFVECHVHMFRFSMIIFSLRRLHTRGAAAEKRR